MADDDFNLLKSNIAHLPGPQSLILAMRIGYLRSGIFGLLISGIAFLLPGVLILSLIALYYKALVALPVTAPFLVGIRVAALVILLYSILLYSFKYMKDLKLLGVFIFVTGASFAGLNLILLMALAMASGLVFYLSKHQSTIKRSGFLLLFVQDGSWDIIQRLFKTFIKAIALIFGSSYVMFAFLRNDLVVSNLLSTEVLLDGVSFSLFAPGPTTLISAFVGYQLADWQGLTVALFALFFVAIFYCFIEIFCPNKYKSSPIWHAMFGTVLVSTLGILMAAVINSSMVIMKGWHSWFLAFVAFLILIKWPKINLIWLIIICANLGYILNYYFL